ncbi:MAG: transposase zinc-binding domain-containing protein, partial [Kiritimatiellia bacterium]|nr:transposase zinc-binding domain-containing protein [Kiritimatiellia bacterium]
MYGLTRSSIFFEIKSLTPTTGRIFLKPVVADVVNNYLDCGDLTKGFARIYCEDCKKSMLLPFSCKGRWFCPSCHEKKVLLFGEFITGTIAFPV